MKLYKKLVDSELLAEIRTAFDRIKDEIGFDNRHYIDYNDQYLMATFKSIIDNPEFSDIVCEGENNDQALMMERAIFSVDGAWGTLTEINSPEKQQPWIADVVKKIHQTMSPLGNIINHPIDLMFVRVHLPSDLHVDKSFEPAEHNEGYTIIMPLTFSPGIKTVSWSQEFASRRAVEEWKNATVRGNPKKTTTGVPPGIDLRHCVIGDKFLPDYLEHVQHSDWEEGAVIVFERQRIHCSSNFRNHLPFKDYVLIHSQDGRYAD